MNVIRLLSPLRTGRKAPAGSRLIHLPLPEQAATWGLSHVRVYVQKEPRVGRATFDQPWAGPRSGYVALAEWLMRRDRPRW